MRPINTLLAAAAALFLFGGCGTKGPLTLPAPAQPAAKPAAPAPAAAEPPAERRP